MAMLSDGVVPADRWRVVLIAGDNNSPAFDNGVEAMRAKLVARGVRDIRALTSDPGANPSLPVATAANVSSALRTAGGEACLAFITSHGDESGFVLKQARGTVSPGTLDNALDAGCGARPTVVVVSACHSGVFLTSGMRQPNRIVLAAAAADRVELRLRRQRPVHLLRPVPAAAVRRGCDLAAARGNDAHLRREPRAQDGHPPPVAAADVRRVGRGGSQDPGALVVILEAVRSECCHPERSEGPLLLPQRSLAALGMTPVA